MNDNVKKSYYNIITDIIGKLVTLAVSILLPKFYIDYYGSEYNGLLTSLNSIFIYLNLLEAGIGSASIQALYKPIIKKDIDKISAILSATKRSYFKNGIIFLSGLSLLAFSYPALIDSNIGYKTIVLLVFLSATPYIIKFFFQGKYTVLLTADNHLYILNLINNIVHVLANIIKALLLYKRVDIVLVQTVFAIIYSVQVIMVAIYVKLKYKTINFRSKPDLQSISKSKAAMVHEFAYVIFNNVDVFLLTIFCGLKVVSVYSIYNLIYSQLTQLLQSITNGTNATLGQLYAANKNKYKEIYQNFEFVFQCIACLLLVTAGTMTKAFVYLYTKNAKDIDYIIPGVVVLFVIIQVLSLLRWPGVAAIKAAGYFKETSKQAITEVIINIILSITLVFKFQIYGVLIATVIALAYRTTDIIRFVHINILEEKGVRQYIKLLIMCVYSAIIFAVEYCLNIKAASYFQFILQGIACFLINVILYLIFILVVDKKAIFHLYNIIKPKIWFF